MNSNALFIPGKLKSLNWCNQNKGFFMNLNVYYTITCIGVQKEFFQLIMDAIFDPLNGMFMYNPVRNMLFNYYFVSGRGRVREKLA